jgi:hypothetical protein
MEISDTQVIAYVDDELPEVERAAVEAAAAEDPALAARIAGHKALRSRLAGAFAGALDEPAPDPLVALIVGSAPAQSASGADNVVDLARVRTLRADPKPRPRPVWLAWAALAACLVVGAVMLQDRLVASAPSPIAVAGGTMVAKGALARALDRQLASGLGSVEPGVKVLVSFKSVDGRYCRSFQLTEGAGMAGVACRGDVGWTVMTAAAAAPVQPNGGYRTAASEIPPAITDTVDAMIAGQPLDAAAEKAAKDRGWRR